MPTIKIKKMSYDSAETFNALRKLGLIDFIYNKFKIYDAKLFDKLNQLKESGEIISRLKLENIQLKKKQVDTSALQEKNKLLSEYQDQIEQYKSEINKLKSQEKQQSNQIQELNKKIKNLKDNNQVLQNEKQDLLASNKEFQESVEKHEDIKDIFNKWGTYQSLQKDVAIVKYFMERPRESIRQKTVIEYFKNYMDKTTVREHLYKLVRKDILSEPEFKGTYSFNYPRYHSDMAIDMDRVAEIILGEDLYKMAVDQYKQKNDES